MKSGHRLGPTGYARILHQFGRRPTSWQQLTPLGLAGKTAAQRAAVGMHSLGLIHIAAWVAAPETPLVPLYRLGAGADVPPPTHRPSGHRVKGITKARGPRSAGISLIAFRMVIEALQVPMSLNELQAETGMTWGYCDGAVKALRAVGLAYVEGWRHSPYSGKHIAAHYAFGRGKDVAKPAPDRNAGRRAWLARKRERDVLAPLQWLGQASKPTTYHQRA